MCFANEAMVESLGLAWALRITAIITLVVNFTATLLIRSRNEEIDPTQRMFDVQLLKRYHVVLVLMWGFVVEFGFVTLTFSLSDYTLSIGRSSSDSATVAAILNLGSALGRPFLGHACDRFGRVEVATISALACGILCFALWMPTTSYGVLILFAFINGTILGLFWVVSNPPIGFLI